MMIDGALRGGIRGLARGGAGRRTLGAGAANGLTLQRASAGAYFDSAGVARIVGADVPRFPGLARRLLIEGQRQNGIRNPRAEGITPGTIAPGGQGGSLMPTNWTMPNHTSGLSIDVSPVADLGMTGLRLRYYGTVSSSNGNETIEFDARNTVPCAAGQTRTHSFFYRLSAGTWPAGVQFQTRSIAGNNNPSFSLVVNDASSLALPTAELQRAERIITLPGDTLTSSPTIVHGAHMPGWNTPGLAVDMTLDLFWPQSEPDAPFASSPILPPAGTQEAATRAADRTQMPIGARGGLAFGLVLPVYGDASNYQGILHADQAGLISSRFLIWNTSSAGSISLLGFVDGSQVGSVSLGTLALNVPTAVAVAWDESGVRAKLRGGSAVSIAAAFTGLATVRLGTASNTYAANRQMTGEIGPVDYYPTPLSLDAMLARIP